MSEATPDGAEGGQAGRPDRAERSRQGSETVGPFGALFQSFEHFRKVDVGETPPAATFDPRWRD